MSVTYSCHFKFRNHFTAGLPAEAAMWVGLGAVKDQAMITGTELEQLSTAQRKALRILGRLRELTAA